MPSSDNNSDHITNNSEDNSHTDQANDHSHENHSNSQDSSGNSHSTNNNHDSSGNSHSTYVTNVRDISGSFTQVVTVCEDDTTMPVPVPIVSDLSQVTIIGDGYQVTNETGKAADSSSVIRTTFTSTDPSNNDPNISENLSEIVTTYNDAIDNSATSILLQQIQTYASDIKCTDFHGKGSIDDYTALFQKAASIANESKQMELDIDIEGFSEFGQAADELSNLFESFITKLQNVNIITDITFLTTISIALGKIANLSNVFGKFKQTIFSTTTVEVPKSVRDTKVVVQGVMDEVNCAMQYINYFVSPTDSLPEAELTSTEKNIITQAISTIDTWNILCEQGVSIAMANDTDIQYIKNASTALKSTTQNLKSVTSALKNKLVTININC
jgi:hypothetical protein